MQSDPGDPVPGQAEPYPSQIVVEGQTGSISDLNVTLRGFTHTSPQDVEILLVGPSRERTTLLMQGSGGGEGVTGLTVTFDDDASPIPADSLTDGSFRPTSVDPSGFRDKTGRAPSPPHGTALSVFDGRDPNGTWELYILNPTPGASGSISNGWTLDFELDGDQPPSASGGGQATGPGGRAGLPDASGFSNYFLIQGDGTAYIGENGPDGPTNFTSAFTPAVVRSEAPNRVAGEGVGGSEGVTLRMFVNGVAVDTVIDGVDPMPGGTVGMRAESRRESAEVEFDDFLVTRAG